MAIDRADKAIADHLATELPSFDLGTNIFNGPLREDIGLAIYCLLDGGPAPIKCKGVDTDGNELHTKLPNVLVRIRGKKELYDDGLECALAVQEALHYADIDGYIDVQIIGSAPNYFGEQDDGHHNWTMTAQLWKADTATGQGP